MQYAFKVDDDDNKKTKVVKKNNRFWGFALAKINFEYNSIALE